MTHFLKRLVQRARGDVAIVAPRRPSRYEPGGIAGELQGVRRPGPGASGQTPGAGSPGQDAHAAGSPGMGSPGMGSPGMGPSGAGSVAVGWSRRASSGEEIRGPSLSGPGPSGWSGPRAGGTAPGAPAPDPGGLRSEGPASRSSVLPTSHSPSGARRGTAAASVYTGAATGPGSSTGRRAQGRSRSARSTLREASRADGDARVVIAGGSEKAKPDSGEEGSPPTGSLSVPSAGRGEGAIPPSRRRRLVPAGTEAFRGGKQEPSKSRHSAEAWPVSRDPSPAAIAGRQGARRELPPEPTVTVTIGRIEVRAVQPPPRVLARPAPDREGAKPGPSSSLEDYLQRRREGGR